MFPYIAVAVFAVLLGWRCWNGADETNGMAGFHPQWLCHFE